MADQRIHWKTDKTFELEGLEFLLTLLVDPKTSFPKAPFWVFKDRRAIRDYEDLSQKLIAKRVFELGILRGGSCVFLHALFKPEKLVAIDLSEKQVRPLHDYIETHQVQHSLVTYYGVNQSDNRRVEAILDQEFGDETIDLVVDDASHFYNQTRAAFNVLFPRMSSGGAYIIEDWSWAHADIVHGDDCQGFYPDQEPLTRLIFELVLACGSIPDLIDKIEINDNTAVIWRGSKQVQQSEFQISDCFVSRGRNMLNS